MSVLTGKGIGISAPDGIRPGRTFHLQAAVRNDGDRVLDAPLAAAASGRLTPRRTGVAPGPRPDVAVDFDIPPLVPGQGKPIMVPISLRIGFPTGEFDVPVALNAGVPEYTTVNNVGTRTLFVSAKARAGGGAITP